MDAFASRIDEALQATSPAQTNGEGAQRQAQRSGGETMPGTASACDEEGATEPDAGPKEEARNLLRVASLGDGMRDNSKAEGTGLEPATGKPAPEFQSGR